MYLDGVKLEIEVILGDLKTRLGLLPVLQARQPC